MLGTADLYEATPISRYARLFCPRTRASAQWLPSKRPARLALVRCLQTPFGVYPSPVVDRRCVGLVPGHDVRQSPTRCTDLDDGWGSLLTYGLPWRFYNRAAQAVSRAGGAQRSGVLDASPESPIAGGRLSGLVTGRKGQAGVDSPLGLSRRAGRFSRAPPIVRCDWCCWPEDMGPHPCPPALISREDGWCATVAVHGDMSRHHRGITATAFHDIFGSHDRHFKRKRLG